MKLSITDTILDKLGFSEYWDDNCISGERVLTFPDKATLVLLEQEEMDDDEEGYHPLGKYVSHHWSIPGWKQRPQILSDSDCYFIHEMYAWINTYHTEENLKYFEAKLKSLRMWRYIEWYIKEGRRESSHI